MQRDFRCSSIPRWTLLTILAMGALLLLAGTATAGEEGAATPAKDEEAVAASQQEAAGTEAQADDAAAEMPEGLSAMRVYRDPETGELTHQPPPGLARGLSEEMRRRVSRSSEGLRARTLPDGTNVLNLQGRFLALSVAKRTADGKVVTDCVTGTEKAEAFFDSESRNEEDQGEEDHDDS